MTFAQAVQSTITETFTTNGMPAIVSTTNPVVDLFFNIGASRGKDIVPSFERAYQFDNTLSLKVAAWARDIRGGAGERELTKQILGFLENVNPEDCIRLLKLLPEIGRWDDGLSLKTKKMKALYFSMIQEVFQQGQKAKIILKNIDSMSEEECEQLLKSV